MIGVKQIKTDGTEINLSGPITLPELQAMTDGDTDHNLIEMVAMTEYNGQKQASKYEVGGHTMVVNEGGLMFGLEPNERAMDVLGYWRNASMTPIVGDVVIIQNEAKDFY